MTATNRPDGRSENTLRPLTCELACLQNCDGSALWKAGGTHVLAAVHGPTAPRQLQQEVFDKCRVQVIVKRGGSPLSFYEREWESFLTRILTACLDTKAHPRTLVSITLQIVSADGSVVAAALHAAVSALMDAGVELQTLPTAVTCLVPHQSNSNGSGGGGGSSSIQLDPCLEEEQRHDAGVLVLVLQQQQQQHDGDEIVLLGSHSSADLQQSTITILQCCKVAQKASQAIHAFWRLAVESKVKRESQTLWSS